jgi:hypothetical protein
MQQLVGKQLTANCYRSSVDAEFTHRWCTLPCFGSTLQHVCDLADGAARIFGFGFLF